MSKQDFDSINFGTNGSTNTGSKSTAPQVGFFQLKNDGDEAVVRFMCDSTKDFEIFTTHTTPTANNKYMKVNCLREATDPVSKCPLCESKAYKLTQTFCITLIQYEKQADNTIVATPKVWARPISFAQKLKSYIDNYGPLSDVICKVIRHGAGLQTEYEVVPNLSKAIFRDDLYVKDTTPFKDYTALGKVVANKSADDMRVYLETKAYPVKTPTTKPTSTTPIETVEPTNQSVDIPFDEPVVAEPAPAKKPGRKSTKSTATEDFAAFASTSATSETPFESSSEKMPWEL